MQIMKTTHIPQLTHTHKYTHTFKYSSIFLAPTYLKLATNTHAKVWVTKVTSVGVHVALCVCARAGVFLSRDAKSMALFVSKQMNELPACFRCFDESLPFQRKMVNLGTALYFH